MANASLAAKYRPQTFAQVVGQDMVKSILSRAAQEDRVAPAYLLSGTRGVGKTTVARIFAKALNCAHAPTGEPCNKCEACRRITRGGFVDVVEIDGASNRGIDDVRRLRDAVGYAPLEGRYKVFIIDEAHMLTKEAFNALLKTLEEPPARVTFIMATTEEHKFPVTIVSRCQHFVFRQIPESTLEAHIISVLQQEGRPFEPEAARLVAKRAAGSVRDAMSLLGQTLALGSPDGAAPLTAGQTREVLGLAGREVLERLLAALADQNALAVSALVRELLLQGVDMGFFLRELGSLWRNLFLLRQAGAGADIASALDLPEKETARLAELASRFSLTFIHAAWQMTLDGQRRILTSLEPSAGLELLLLNLALLPRLLPLNEFDASRVIKSSGGDSVPSTILAVNPPVSAPSSLLGRDVSAVSPESRLTPSPTSELAPVASANPAMPCEAHACNWAHSAPEELAPLASSDEALKGNAPPFDLPPCDQDEHPAWGGAGGDNGNGGMPVSFDEMPSTARPPEMVRKVSPSARSDGAGLSWQGFLIFCQDKAAAADLPLAMLHQFDGEVDGDEFKLRARSQVMFNQMQRPAMLAALEKLAADWAGRPLRLAFLPPLRERRTEAELLAEMTNHPVVKSLQDLYGGTLVRCTAVDENR